MINKTYIATANRVSTANKPNRICTKIEVKRPILTVLGDDISRFISILGQNIKRPTLLKTSSSIAEEFTLDDFSGEDTERSNECANHDPDSNTGCDGDPNPEAEPSSDDSPDDYALLYARVSSYDQVKNSMGDDEESDDEEDAHEGSIDDQVEELIELAEKHGLELAHPPITDKARTGRDFDREGIQKIFSLAQRDEVEYLLVQEIDRIGRSAAETLYFIYLLQSECGVTLLTPSAEHDVGEIHGLMHTTLLSLMAEVQNEIRTSKAKASRVRGFIKRKQWNNLTSVIPIGYRESDGWLEPDPDELDAVNRLFQVFVECQTYAETERTLNSEFDGILDGHSVKTLLQNPVYIGKPQVPDEWVIDQPFGPVVDDPDLKLIDEELFDEVQAIIEEKNELHSRNDDTDQVMKFVEEFDLFTVIASTPLATLVHDCGEPMRRNGQYNIRGGVETVEFECTTCEETRRWPRDEEYDRMELIYTVRQGSTNWLKNLITKLKGS